MNYNWRELAKGLRGSAEHEAFLDARVNEMSPKEWRIFKGAMEMMPQEDLPGIIALTGFLGNFSYYFPADNNEMAGYLLAKHNYGVRDDVLPYIDPSKVFMEYQSTNGGVIADGAFVSGCSPFEVNRIKEKTEEIRNGAVSTDNNWSAKLLISGPTGREAWLRLPDYEEVNGGEADEIATLLHEIGADSLDECSLFDAKCFLPGIDLMAYDKSLPQLIFDASNIWFAIEEYEHGTEYFHEKLQNALEYENCTRLDLATDIVTNIGCYDFVPNSDLRATAENIMPSKHFKQDAIMKAFDHKAYAANYYSSRGMLKVDGGFFMRNDKEFRFDYSLPPEQQASLDRQKNLANRLNDELDRCWDEYKTERIIQEPEWIFSHAEDIAATDAAYGAFRHGAGLTTEMMEHLLQFENPLEILSDAWTRGIQHEDASLVTTRVQEMLDHPFVGESYDLLPDFSWRPTIQEQQMGGYDG